jgi:hypothetical protein
MAFMENWDSSNLKEIILRGFEVGGREKRMPDPPIHAQSLPKLAGHLWGGCRIFAKKKTAVMARITAVC